MKSKKVKNIWRYAAMFEAMRALFENAEFAYKILVSEVHYYAAPFVIKNGVIDEVSYMDTNRIDSLEAVRDAQHFARYQLIEFLESIGMVADAAALRIIDARTSQQNK